MQEISSTPETAHGVGRPDREAFGPRDWEATMRILSRRDALAIVVGPVLFGLAGCMRSNEENFAPTPGKVDPNIPKSAEEYEGKFKRKKGEA